MHWSIYLCECTMGQTSSLIDSNSIFCQGKGKFIQFTNYSLNNEYIYHGVAEEDEALKHIWRGPC